MNKKNYNNYNKKINSIQYFVQIINNNESTCLKWGKLEKHHQRKFQENIP